MALFFTKDNSIVNLPLKLPLILDLGEKDKHINHSHSAADPQPVQETGCCGKCIGAMKGRGKFRNAEASSESSGFFSASFSFLLGGQIKKKNKEENCTLQSKFLCLWIAS